MVIYTTFKTEEYIYPNKMKQKDWLLNTTHTTFRTVIKWSYLLEKHQTMEKSNKWISLVVYLTQLESIKNQNNVKERKKSPWSYLHKKHMKVTFGAKKNKHGVKRQNRWWTLTISDICNYCSWLITH